MAATTAAVATATSVQESQDAGKTWRTHELPEGFTLSQIYTRPDGVLVAFGLLAGARTTYIKSREDLIWRVASYQPKNLVRQGSWIWNGDTTCVAVLAKDARTWSATPELSALPGYQDTRNQWLSMRFEVSPPSTGFMLNGLTSAPKPPAESMSHQGTTERCQDPIPQASALRPSEPPARGGLKAPCQGAGCLYRTQRPPMPTPATFYAILADQTPTRAASLVRVQMDPERVLVHRPPVGCLPRRVFNAQGLGVLLCERDARDIVSVYTRAPDGPWVREHDFKGRAQSVADASMATDGTLSLRGAL